jgi:type VII secretion-associated protein (TIGR03931 family)
VEPAVSPHRAVIEAGPHTIRRLCCPTAEPGDTAEIVSAALGAIDDPVALAGGRPVAVDSIWRSVLRSLKCAGPGGLVVVHPSWWPPARVDRVAAAATAVAEDALARPRSWLLTHAVDAERGETVVVEIAERLVMIAGAEVVAVPRRAPPHPVVDEVARTIAGMAPMLVVIDASGAPALAATIAGAVRAAGRAVVEIGEDRLPGLARSALPDPDPRSGPEVTAKAGGHRSRVRTMSGLAATVAAMTLLPLAISAPPSVGRHGASSPAQVQAPPTTFLVEGRVALTVPADWATQRVVSGPGSARVQLTSPSDPEVALHVTQSPVPGETLSGTAERLKRAIDAEPAGVFVDFNPAGTSAGRPAVTYRELRPGHQVRWTVLLDGPVRISVGCQSRPADEGAVRDACEQAVRSAHSIG